MALFDNYQTDGFYDEMFTPEGHPRPHYQKLFQRLAHMAMTRERKNPFHSILFPVSFLLTSGITSSGGSSSV